jgi:hypothetical protein
VATTNENRTVTSGWKLEIFNLSQSHADLIFKISNIGLIFGALFVLLGTIGAIWTGAIRERYSDERTARNEAETATAKATAASANARAASANERAATANENAALANERTEELKKFNLQLQTELEKERVERLRLEASIAPRHISEKQRGALIAALRAAPQPISVQVTLIGDEESANYGKLLINALGAAGVQGQTSTMGIVSPPQYGVSIRLDKNRQKSHSIKAAFEKAHIPVNISFGETGAFDAVIFVGLRPLGPSL